MGEDLWLAERFEEHRGRLKAVAARMLGSGTEADDALQEAWIRFNRADTSGVENLGSWLTTVVSRVCLDMLQDRRRRRAGPVEDEFTEPAAGAPDTSPEDEALLADSIGLALMVVLDSLTPAERVALVLHDMFGVPFDDIAPIVGRNATATRQLASRARRRVRGRGIQQHTDRLRQAGLVEAFLAAARGGDFEGLLAVLDPDVVLRADDEAVRAGAPAEVRGAVEVAGFLRVARGAQAAMVDRQPGVVWAPGGRPRVVLRFTVAGGRVVAVDAIADHDALRRIDLVM